MESHVLQLPPPRPWQFPGLLPNMFVLIEPPLQAVRTVSSGPPRTITINSGLFQALLVGSSMGSRLLLLAVALPPPLGHRVRCRPYFIVGGGKWRRLARPAMHGGGEGRARRRSLRGPADGALSGASLRSQVEVGKPGSGPDDAEPRLERPLTL